MLAIASGRRQATDFEQLKPEGLDLGEHAVQRGLMVEFLPPPASSRYEPGCRQGELPTHDPDDS